MPKSTVGPRSKSKSLAIALMLCTALAVTATTSASAEEGNSRGYYDNGWTVSIWEGTSSDNCSMVSVSYSYDDGTTVDETVERYDNGPWNESSKTVEVCNTDSSGGKEESSGGCYGPGFSVMPNRDGAAGQTSGAVLPCGLSWPKLMAANVKTLRRLKISVKVTRVRRVIGKHAELPGGPFRSKSWVAR